MDSIEKTYNGRVSSKGNGVFYSPNQTHNGFSTLPTESTEKMQPIYRPSSSPSQFLESYPRLLVKLQADGSIRELSKDVVCISPDGEYISIDEVDSSDVQTNQTSDDNSSDEVVE
jgi:Ran GTPase-activating protein (RanGAP) involved in mRNA processing and transport